MLRRNLVIAASTLILVVLCCGMAAYVLGMIPPSTTLAQCYLNAVAREDSESAVNLAGTEQRCRSILEGDVREDIAQFGAAEIRNMIIRVY